MWGQTNYTCRPVSLPARGRPFMLSFIQQITEAPSPLGVVCWGQGSQQQQTRPSADFQSAKDHTERGGAEGVPPEEARLTEMCR